MVSSLVGGDAAQDSLYLGDLRGVGSCTVSLGTE